MKENKSFENKSLGEKLKRGVFWQYTQTAFVTGFNFAAGIILARLLDPVDFGVFAAVSAFTSLLLFQVTFGWPAALLRAKELKEPLLSTVFWTMEGAALLLTLLVIAGSQWLGSFYEDHRFSTVMILMCVNFFIMPFNTINGSILGWKMRYDLVSRISMVVVVISTSVGILLAFLGFGVYSLVYSGILSSLFLTTLIAFFAPWKPQFVLSWQSVRSLFNFSWRLHLNNTLSMVSSRIDNMLIGKLVGIQQLGIYVKAFSLGRMPVDLLGGNLYQMFFTALCRLRDNRSDSVAMFQKMIASLTLAIYLPLLVLFFVGEGFIVNLYGAKWVDAVLPMQVMLIGSFAVVINMTCVAFCNAQNLVKQLTKVQCINLILTTLAVIIGSRWGLVGVASGITFKSFIMLILIGNILITNMNLRWYDLWYPVWPSICATLFGLAAGEAVIYFIVEAYAPRNLWQMLLIASSAGAAYISSWLALAHVFEDHMPMSSILDVIKGFLVRLPKIKLAKIR